MLPGPAITPGGRRPESGSITTLPSTSISTSLNLPSPPSGDLTSRFGPKRPSTFTRRVSVPSGQRPPFPHATVVRRSVSVRLRRCQTSDTSEQPTTSRRCPQLIDYQGAESRHFTAQGGPANAPASIDGGAQMSSGPRRPHGFIHSRVPAMVWACFALACHPWTSSAASNTRNSVDPD